MPRAPLTWKDEVAAQQMVEMINEIRQFNGRGPLTMNYKLCEVAKGHALDMLYRGYMAHETPEGVNVPQRVSEAGINFHAVGENIAGTPTFKENGHSVTGYRSLYAAHCALWGSDGHRANILGDFTEVGVGQAVNPDKTIIVVEVFIRA